MEGSGGVCYVCYQDLFTLHSLLLCTDVVSVPVLCTHMYTGNVTRVCDPAGNWMEPNVSECQGVEFAQALAVCTVWCYGISEMVTLLLLGGGVCKLTLCG